MRCCFIKLTILTNLVNIRLMQRCQSGWMCQSRKLVCYQASRVRISFSAPNSGSWWITIKTGLINQAVFLLLKKNSPRTLANKKDGSKNVTLAILVGIVLRNARYSVAINDCSLRISFSAPRLKFVKISKRPNVIWSFSFGLSIWFILWMLV